MLKRLSRVSTISGNVKASNIKRAVLIHKTGPGKRGPSVLWEFSRLEISTSYHDSLQSLLELLKIKPRIVSGAFHNSSLRQL